VQVEDEGDAVASYGYSRDERACAKGDGAWLLRGILIYPPRIINFFCVMLLQVINFLLTHFNSWDYAIYVSILLFIHNVLNSYHLFITRVNPCYVLQELSHIFISDSNSYTRSIIKYNQFIRTAIKVVQEEMREKGVGCRGVQ
jgi:hypothetical protein